MNPSDYRIVIDRLSAEDGGGFLATVPDLPGCMSDGETPEEALRNGLSAAGEWIEYALRVGLPVPAPAQQVA